MCMNIYNPCPCDSGKKFKFCCSEAIKNGDTAYLETRMVKFPVQCWGRDDYQKDGMMMAVVARKTSDDNYIVGHYLVDLWCLGVKDADLKANISRAQLEKILEGCTVRHEMVDYSYERMRSLLLGSIAYAANLGIAPHEDWERAKFLVESDRSFENSFTFGRDGKPLYVAGPNDQQMQHSLMAKINKVGGNWIGEL